MDHQSRESSQAHSDLFLSPPGPVRARDYLALATSFFRARHLSLAPVLPYRDVRLSAGTEWIDPLLVALAATLCRICNYVTFESARHSAECRGE